MDLNNSETDFNNSLVIVIRKILTSELKADVTYLEKLLSCLKSEYGDKYFTILKLPKLSECLLDTFQSWESQQPNVGVAGFTCQLMGVLARNEEGFHIIQSHNALDKLISVLHHPSLQSNSLLKISFIKMLAKILNHKSGCKWVIDFRHWKIVSTLYLSNLNYYVEQEGLTFFKKLFKSKNLGDNDIEEIFHEILTPINCEKSLVEETGERMYMNICRSLKLLQGILKNFIDDNDNTVMAKLSKVLDLEKHLKLLLENCKQEKTLEIASILYITYILLNFQDKKQLLEMQNISSDILDIFVLLLNSNQIECIIKLAKFCQTILSEIRCQLNCDSTIIIHFIIFQLIPVFLYKTPPESKIFDYFLQKLFDLTSESSQRFGYSLRDKIKSKNDSRDCALKSLLSVTANLSNLSHNEAVIIFQSVAYMLKVFVPQYICDEEAIKIENEISLKDMLPCVEDVTLLSAVLNSLCLLIEKFKINWTESLESLCLLKMTCKLLENSHLSSILIVQTLLLVKLAILNYMSPNLALLLNKTQDSSFECLLPLLYKHLHNPNWEIRDSCIEVISTIAELAESKYPAFQYVLLKQNFSHLLCDIVDGDSESYVRASALRALSSMIKIENIRQNMNTLGFPLQIVKLLQSESEGIVRREAVLLINQIYTNMSETSDIAHSLYDAMGYAAICDLHWEVKVNSLFFWESVIQKVLADQGMIDGSFPKVTFSKEHKKIVTLTNEEVSKRVVKALKELSKIGCLHVLLSSLNDDCDFQVVKKSAQILSDFMSILQRFGITTPYEKFASNRANLKRKYIESSTIEKKKPPNVNCSFENQAEEPNDCTAESDAVIEEIVNEMDINLLVTVYKSDEKKCVLPNKNVLQEIQPEVFLIQMHNFNAEKFLEDKKKWFMNVDVDLKSLINDIIAINSVSETNIMDCY